VWRAEREGADSERSSPDKNIGEVVVDSDDASASNKKEVVTGSPESGSKPRTRKT